MAKPATAEELQFEKFEQDLRDGIADQPMSRVQVAVVALCFVLNMIDGVDVLIVSFTGALIEAEWGLSKTELGAVYSVGLFGMMIGCLAIAPIADTIGRKALLIGSTVAIMIGMISASFAQAYEHLLAARLLAGLGIGAILPVMAATAAEFANKRWRDAAVSVVQAGWPIGAILTGFFVAWAVPQFGWRFVFLAAGLLSAAMLPLLIWMMPESLEFLGRRQPKNARERINALLARMGRAPLSVLPPRPATLNTRVTVSALFSRQYIGPTLLLWVGIFFGFMTLYTLISWVPNIATSSGMPFELATFAGTALNVGAFVGSVAIGVFAPRWGIRRLIFAFLVCAFVLMVAYGNLPLSTVAVFVLIVLIGVTVQGGFNGFYPAAARIYPASLRATGVGWAVGAGRMGAIIGPALFGVLLDAEVAIGVLFAVFSVPLLIAAAAALFNPSPELKVGA